MKPSSQSKAGRRKTNLYFAASRAPGVPKFTSRCPGSSHGRAHVLGAGCTDRREGQREVQLPCTSQPQRRERGPERCACRDAGRAVPSGMLGAQGLLGCGGGFVWRVFGVDRPGPAPWIASFLVTWHQAAPRLRHVGWTGPRFAQRVRGGLVFWLRSQASSTGPVDRLPQAVE